MSYLKQIISLAQTREEQDKRRLEEEREEYQRRHTTALNEIQAELNTSNYIYTCTNNKLRHAYAKDLASKYSQKYNIHITIGSIDNLVERTFKERKI